jgi:hypothetical protein
MPNIAAALKAEIGRVARKETKGEIEALKKIQAQQRRLLQELRGRVDQTERSLG